MYVCRQTSAQQHTLSLVNTHKHTHHLCDCQRSVGVESVERSWTSVTHSVCEASLGRLKALTAASKRTLSLVCQIIVVASPRFPSAGWFFLATFMAVRMLRTNFFEIDCRLQFSSFQQHYFLLSIELERLTELQEENQLLSDLKHSRPLLRCF